MEKYNNFFNQDFYPTPNHVIDLMELNVKGKTILEPSAGKGNIIDYVLSYGAKEVYFCEINKDLSAICERKNATKIKSNFLEVTQEEIIGVNCIVMNPPFSEFRKHIEHAWRIAPDGCEIISLGNYDTIKSLCGNYSEKEMKYIVDNFGMFYELGEVFSTAERQTNVNIGVIKLFKPIDENSMNFDDYFDFSEIEVVEQEGLIRYNKIDTYVSSFKYIVKNLDAFFNGVIFFQNIVHQFSGINLKVDISLTSGENSLDKNIFKKQLQKLFWGKVFHEMKIEKYVSSDVMKDINAFIDKNKNLPFTKNNIFRMIEIIIGTREHTLKRSIENVIDSFTKHTHENRYNVEGWKTNSGHLLNKKFIVDHFYKLDYNGNTISPNSSYRQEQIRDLEKVLCVLSGKNYDKVLGIQDTCKGAHFIKSENGEEKLIPYSDDYRKNIPNTWYETEFFEFKGFKKGTAHIKFKDMKLWEHLNRKYAEIKGNVLPEKI